MNDKLTALLAILDKLTWSRILKAGAAGLIGSGINYLWNNGTTAIPAVLGSSTAVTALGSATACVVVWLIGSAMLDRMDRKGNELDHYLRSEIARIQLALDAVVKREADCQRRLERAERAMRKAGLYLQPDSADFEDSTK